MILALPRGGVPVAFEIAKRFELPMDVFVVRKLGVPGHEEYAMGAVASGGVRVLNTEVIRQLRIPESAIDRVAAREEEEIGRRERLYRGNQPLFDLTGKIIILVDDGLATGATMRAAVSALRQKKPSRIVVAVPVGSTEACALIRSAADELHCPSTPEPFQAVGLWFDDFSQTSDDEVRRLLGTQSE